MGDCLLVVILGNPFPFLVVLSKEQIFPSYRDGAVSQVVPLSVDSVAVGLVTSVLVYPIYLFILFLFRRARSKVS